MDTLAANAQADGLVLLTGAGVSIPAPSCLPNWSAFNTAVLKALAEQFRIYKDDASGTADFLLGPVLTGRDTGDRWFSPDYQAQIIEDQCGEEYFRVLQSVDIDETNAVHRAAAAMASRGHLRAIITTNWDRLHELALDQAGVKYRRFYSPGDFNALPACLADPKAPLLVIKAHGSVESPASMVDTRRQRLRGRPKTLEDAIAALLERHPCLIAGWSGADLAYDSNYLGLIPGAKAGRIKGVTYLNRAGSARNPAIDPLLNALGPERSRVIDALLPDFLANLAARLGATSGPDDPIDRSSERSAQLQSRATAWAASLGGLQSINILGALLMACGHENEALRLFSFTFRHYRRSADCHGPVYARFNYNMGSALLAHGMVGNPVKIAPDKSNLMEWMRAAEKDAFTYFARAESEGELVEAKIERLSISGYRGHVKGAISDLFNVWKKCGEERNARGYIEAAAALGPLLDIQGEFQVAVELLTQCESTAKQLGDEPRAALLSIRLARPLAWLNRADEAESRMLDVIATAARLRLRSIGALALAERGALRLRQDRHAESLADLLEANQQLTDLQRRLWLGRVRLDLASAAFLAGNDKIYETALDAFDDLGEVVGAYKPHAFLLIAEVSLRHNAVEQARRFLAAGAELADRFENPWAKSLIARLQQELAK